MSMHVQIVTLEPITIKLKGPVRTIARHVRQGLSPIPVQERERPRVQPASLESIQPNPMLMNVLFVRRDTKPIPAHYLEQLRVKSALMVIIQLNPM